MLITRSRRDNEELARRLRLLGLDPIPVDTISFAPPADWSKVDSSLRNLHSFDWVLFTSSTGAEYFGKRMGELSLELPWKGSPRVATVGRQTAAALSRLGIEVGFVPSSFTSADLGEELPGVKGERVLLLRSDAANPALEERLTARGFRVEKAAVYRTIPVSGPGPKISEADIIVFASPSAVRSLCARATDSELRRLTGLRAICIGPVTESAARDNGFKFTTRPESFTLDAVVQEVRRLSGQHA